ncbi:RNA methyltransferase [Schaalia sp. lx-260]|nr:RNA methyltransferase [Schaalia sp. lx-260]
MHAYAERPPLMANPHADRVKKIAGLVGRSARSRAQLLLIEGPQAVRELVTFRPATVRDIYITDEVAERDPELFSRLCQATRWVHPVTPEVAHTMSRDAQGILATATPDCIESELPDNIRIGGTLVIIAQGRDPGNVGTIIRTSDAMGAQAVLTVRGTVDIASPKVIRASAGSLFHLPVVSFPSFHDAVITAKQRGARILGTSGSAVARDLTDLMCEGIRGTGLLTHAHAWVMGNEAQGMSYAEMEACDELVRITMSGHAESMNVATAAAMCLYASQTVRMNHI